MELYIWGVEPKIVVKPPKSSILIGFSIIFTIHFGGFPHIFGLTPIWRYMEGDGGAKIFPASYRGGQRCPRTFGGFNYKTSSFFFLRGNFREFCVKS